MIAVLTVVLGLASACIGPTEGGSGGNGGAGVGGSGGSAPCAADETRSCYSGPEGTDGVGICVAGVETCRSDGTWGPCEDEVLPDVEDCTAVGDEDCNAIACSEMVFGMSGDEVEWVQDVVVDSAGNAIMTIEMNTTLTLAGVTFTASGVDLIVIKLDPNGDPI